MEHFELIHHLTLNLQPVREPPRIRRNLWKSQLIAGMLISDVSHCLVIFFYNKTFDKNTEIKLCSVTNVTFFNKVPTWQFTLVNLFTVYEQQYYIKQNENHLPCMKTFNYRDYSVFPFVHLIWPSLRNPWQ